MKLSDFDYGSYKEPRQLMWLIGIIIFFLMMATAFLGYTLPWGQMSYWGATVITNLFSAVPFIILFTLVTPEFLFFTMWWNAILNT